MDLLYSEFQKEPKKRFVIILDNLKVHKTKEVISFCKERKINLLFNVPYQSVFNSIELCFRALKKMIYSKIYETTEEIKLDIENIIKTEKFRNTLYYNYKETLKEFLYYEQNHKYDNLN
jgi:transposase